jgi:hypothetical protein
MPQIEIPEEWRKTVCSILNRGAAGREIQWTEDATARYKADSNFSWDYEANEAFLSFLSGARAFGCHVVMDTPPGETYEFYFPFKKTSFYGKILLRTDRARIVIFSAHRPLKNKLSCE